jgi:hypothetical protein
MSLALARYNFSTPEIRVLMRQVLGYALSGQLSSVSQDRLGPD